MKHTPAEHPAHDATLAERLVGDRITQWIDTAIGTQLAGYGDEHDRERAAVDEMRHVHMSGRWYGLVPRILDDLRRAGLLKEDPR